MAVPGEKTSVRFGLNRSRHSRGRTSRFPLGADTAVARPRGSRFVRTRPWLDLAAPVGCGHGRGRTSQLPFGADTGVAGPHGSRLVQTQPWQHLTGSVWREHGRGGPFRADTVGTDLVLECLIADAVRELEAGQKG